jgi:putative resolvase
MKLTINEASKLLGVSISTLRRWELDGKIVPEKTKEVSVFSTRT